MCLLARSGTGVSTTTDASATADASTELLQLVDGPKKIFNKPTPQVKLPAPKCS